MRTLLFGLGQPLVDEEHLLPQRLELSPSFAGSFAELLERLLSLSDSWWGSCRDHAGDWPSDPDEGLRELGWGACGAMA